MFRQKFSSKVQGGLRKENLANKDANIILSVIGDSKWN
jgi:hypothetical protein